MTPIINDTWFMPETITPNELIKKLSKKFRIHVDPQPVKTVTYFDTFDWRLFRKRYLLCRTSKTWQLIRIDSGERLISMDDSGLVPTFAWTFWEGPLKKVMEETLGPRSLLPLGGYALKARHIKVLNVDEKTIARLQINTQTFEGEAKKYGTIRLAGVRGYNAIESKLSRFLKKLGIDTPVATDFLFTGSVSKNSRHPGDYTSKLAIALNPDMTTRQAAKAIFYQLATTMRRNEDGIEKDIDSEFLHDFRVAIRRTRSGLTQIKGALPPQITANIKVQLAELGRMTGPTRDLDVYLLGQEDYLSRLPQALQEGLIAFFEELGEQRQAEWAKMMTTLKSPWYQKTIDDWLTYLKSDDHENPSPHAQRPIMTYARKIIYRRYRRIMKKGGAISSQSPDEALHRLRIQCKKLRYSLEFFTSLFPPEAMVRVIKKLKQLQKHLGNFNDLSVQQEMLREYLLTIKPGSKKNLKLAAAIGGLLTVLNHEQQEIRARFEAVFSEFAGMENTALFVKLFK